MPAARSGVGGPRLALLRLLSVVAGALLAVLLAEAVFRLDGAYARHLEARARWTPGPERWLEEDDEPPWPEEALVLAAIGDSFTHGVGLSLEQTWPSRLAFHLSAGREQTVAVGNFGLNGAGIREAHAELERVLDRYDPAIVVHQLFINDLYGGRYANPEIPPYRGPSNQVLPPSFTLHASYYLWRARNKYPNQRRSFLRHVQAYGRRDLPHWTLVRRDIAAVAELAARHHKPYLAFLLPKMIWRRGDYPLREFHQSVAEHVGAVVPFYFDLLPVLEKRYPSGYAHWVDRDLPDAHPDADVHDCIARAVAAALTAAELLEPVAANGAAPQSACDALPAPRRQPRS